MSDFQPGNHVTVVHGIFSGMTGVVVSAAEAAALSEEAKRILEKFQIKQEAQS